MVKSNWLIGRSRFEIKDLEMTESLQELQQKYIYPAMLEMAKTADGKWVKAHGEYFRLLADEVEGKDIYPECGRVMDGATITTPGNVCVVVSGPT